MQHKNQLIAVLVLFTALLMAGCGFRPAAGAAVPAAEPTPAGRTDLASESDMNRLQAALDQKDAEITRLTNLVEDLQQDNAELREELQETNATLQDILEELRSGNRTEPMATTVPQGNGVEEPRTDAADAPTNSNTITNEATPVNCTFAEPGNLDNMPKTVIEMAQEGVWFHRVFNERLFRAPDWGGADSWFVQLALGPNSGGFWTDHGNPGQIVYRGENTTLEWCLGVLTESDWKDQFMVGEGGDAAINVRIAPNAPVWVVGPGGTFEGVTSDAGDITIILPDEGEITIGTSYTTAAPTHESLVWWGPYDRSENINTIDPR